MYRSSLDIGCGAQGGRYLRQARFQAIETAVSQLEHLLQPTISEDVPHRPLYSVRSGFFVAFFGGVHATLIFYS